jgi:hypothetical protein
MMRSLLALRFENGLRLMFCINPWRWGIMRCVGIAEEYKLFDRGSSWKLFV